MIQKKNINNCMNHLEDSYIYPKDHIYFFPKKGLDKTSGQYVGCKKEENTFVG